MPVDDRAAGTPVRPGRDWVWRVDRVRDLLATEGGDELFVSGCAANMAGLLSSFDDVVLLSAPVDVIAARLAARAPGEYGSAPAERERVLALAGTVEPRLRRVAHHELDTSGTVEDAVTALLALVSAPEQAGPARTA